MWLFARGAEWDQVNKMPAWVLRRLESPEESPTWIKVVCEYSRLNMIVRASNFYK